MRKYLRANPKSTLFAKYADILLEQQKYHEAYVIAIHGVKSHPRFATGWLILGKAALQRGEAPFAKQCWMNALAADKMCLQAAELLLTTEGLDLKMKEAHIAATALLNMDSNHLLARTTMKLIAKEHQTASETTTTARKSSEERPQNATIPQEESHIQQDASRYENLTPFDLYGTGKQHIGDLLRTIDQMRKMKARSKGTETVDSDTVQKPSVEAEQTQQPSSSHSAELNSQEQTEPAASSDETTEDSSPQEDITIPRRMATLTFVEVLKAQGLYENALTVLQMIPKTPSNTDRIEQARNELTSLLEIQQQE